MAGVVVVDLDSPCKRTNCLTWLAHREARSLRELPGLQGNLSPRRQRRRSVARRCHLLEGLQAGGMQLAFSVRRDSHAESTTGPRPESERSAGRRSHRTDPPQGTASAELGRALGCVCAGVGGWRGAWGFWVYGRPAGLSVRSFERPLRTYPRKRKVRRQAWPRLRSFSCAHLSRIEHCCWSSCVHHVEHCIFRNKFPSFRDFSSSTAPALRVMCTLHGHASDVPILQVSTRPGAPTSSSIALRMPNSMTQEW